MTPFSRAFDRIILIEGGYANNPFDYGGKTRYGITESLARECGYTGDMRNLSLSFARYVYKKVFWKPMMLDRVAGISESIADEMFDAAVNMGCNREVNILQRCINVLNIRGTVYGDIKQDGLMGNKTITALKQHLKHRNGDDSVLFNMMNTLQGSFYIELAERRETDEEFIYGWFKNRVQIHGSN